jgi:hypothetical protein
MKSSWLVVGAFSLLPVVAVVACNGGSESSDKAAQDGEIGTVEAAISAVGPDGATYSIPSGAYLVFQGISNGFTCRNLASTATQTFSLPVDTYQVAVSPTCSGSALTPVDAAAGIPYTLTRAADAGATSVTALLQNPLQTVNVTAGSAVSLVFQFTIEQLGSITMSTGAVTVAISTGASAVAAPSKAIVAGSFGPTTFTPGTNAVAGVTALLNPASTSTFTLTLGSLSAFAPTTADEACATFAPTITQSGASAGDTALFQELTAPGTTGQICFFDPNSGAPANQVVISFFRIGAATTTAFQSALAGDGGAPSSAYFYAYLAGTTPTGIYNGTTVAVSQLASPTTLANSLVQLQVLTPSAYGIGVVNGNSTITLQLSP